MWLQAGGVWINLGPLLYHWADSHTYLPDDELSIEISLEDVERIAAELGFITERREMVTAAYAANMRHGLHLPCTALLHCRNPLQMCLCAAAFRRSPELP